MSSVPTPINATDLNGKSSGLIILVEDDHKLRKLYSDMLRSHGYTVIAAKDGEEGLSLLFTNTPRLLILDIIMPNMDGIELCRRAREILGPRIPIIFMTALDQLEIVQVCLEAGGDDYIVKGSNLKTIADRVRYWTKMGSSRKAEKHRSTALAAVRSEMNHAAKEKIGGAAGLSSETDEVIRDISEFLRKALDAAGEGFGNKVEEKLYLLGYTAGLINYWSVAKTHLKSRMNDYIKAVLRETDCFVGAEIESMIESLGKLSGENIFTQAVSRGTAEAVARKAKGPDFVPGGFVRFSEDLRQTTDFGALYSKVFGGETATAS